MRRELSILLAALLLLGVAGCQKETAQPAANQPVQAAPAIALPPASGVPRDRPWAFTLPADLSAEQVEGIAVLQGDKFVAVGAEPKGRQLMINPLNPYGRNTTYTLRLFASGGKRYEGSFTTETYVRVEPGRIHEEAPNPEKGFHFAYFLYLPSDAKPGAPYRFLVAPNDSGGAISDSTAFTVALARKMIQPGTPARTVADALGLAVLVPAIPYPTTPESLYLQTLSRRTLTVTKAPFVRVDEQVTAMLADARQMLSLSGFQTEKQIFLHGSSAAGFFADRFALLHPELVRAISSGNTAGLITLPLSSYEGRTLRYPVGVADLQEVAGVIYRPDQYQRVARFAYMSENSVRDAIRDSHVFEQEDADLVTSLIGMQMLPDRWAKTQQIARDMGLPIQFATYPAGPNVNELIEFFRANMSENGGAAK